MNYLFLDIETTPFEIGHEDIRNYLMDKKISKEARSLDPNYSKIVAIGIKQMDQNSQVLSGNEKEILTQFWNLISSQPKNTVFVTHNGYQFDVPFLTLRSIANNLKIPVKINTNKWSMENSNHFDTMQFFSHYGTFINTNLEILGKMHNIEQERDKITGRDIEELYLQGQIDKINKHCQHDIELLEMIFKKLCLNHLEK